LHSFSLLFLFSVWSTVINSRPIISNDIAANLILLPVAYYSATEMPAFTYPGPITYAQLIQCDTSRGNNPTVLISIIQPDNVDFQVNKPFTLMEISTCEHWDSECIIATNYFYDSQDNLQPFNNVSIPYNDSQTPLYFRFLAAISITSFSIHVSYVNITETFAGEYVSTVFNNIALGNNYYKFSQMAKNDELSTVMTLSSAFYYISFCEDAIIGDYSVTATVNGQPYTPLAGFDLAICSKNVVTQQNCQVYNGGIKGISASETGASVAFVTLDSADVAISDGLYINVNGYGGELDGFNDFILSVVVTPD